MLLFVRLAHRCKTRKRLKLRHYARAVATPLSMLLQNWMLGLTCDCDASSNGVSQTQQTFSSLHGLLQSMSELTCATLSCCKPAQVVSGCLLMKGILSVTGSTNRRQHEETALQALVRALSPVRLPQPSQTHAAE